MKFPPAPPLGPAKVPCCGVWHTTAVALQAGFSSAQQGPGVAFGSHQQLSGSRAGLNISPSHTRRGGIKHYPLHVLDGWKNLGREHWTLIYNIGCDEIQESISLTYTTAINIYLPTESCYTKFCFTEALCQASQEQIPVLEVCRKCISLFLTPKALSPTQHSGGWHIWTLNLLPVQQLIVSGVENTAWLLWNSRLFSQIH